MSLLDKYKSVGIGAVGLVLCAGLLAGCSVFRDYSGDTCDGRKPVDSMEQAGKGLVTAAYDADRDGVCRVTSPFPGGTLDDSMVTNTRKMLAERGITPENVTVMVGEQFGSHLTVHLTDGSQDEAHWLKVDGNWVRDDGFTIGLPPELYPEMPEHPASQSSSTDIAP
ncbi:hypothetical protein [Arthrobacter sp. MYb227]|uniref:hypothetical protein n=1 Tax=Arthrobacter sp. MYb227 TaxID=1848601 RepID=UPI000CFCD8D8|nr:hypothetical protein [Arthrobacter sp. MYb227]